MKFREYLIEKTVVDSIMKKLISPTGYTGPTETGNDINNGIFFKPDKGKVDIWVYKKGDKYEVSTKRSNDLFAPIRKRGTVDSSELQNLINKLGK